MQHLISWKQLLVYLSLAALIYYAYIIFRFYRKDFLLLGKARKTQGLIRSHDLSPKHNSTEEALNPEAILYNIVYELMEDCKSVFRASVEHSLDKEPIIEALQIRIRKYPQVRGTAFQVAITNHIEQELQSRCGIALSDHELDSLWK